MKADGYITIGTKLNTKDLEKGVKKAETELNKLDREAKKLTEQKVTLEADNTELQQTIDKYDNLVSKAETYKKQVAEMEATGNIWNSSYDKAVMDLENINGEIARQEKGMLKAGEQIDKNNNKLNEVEKNLKDNASKQDILNEKVKVMGKELQKSRGVDTLKASVDNISNKMSGIVKKAIKWGLAVFSIRSAYSFIRSSISTVTQYDQQLATDIEYIRWALAMTLKPVIEFVVKLAFQLLGIIRSIVYSLFKYDIFAKAGTKEFKKAKESTSGVAKNIGTATKNAKKLNKELDKQLATFDEMNILGTNVKEAGDTGDTGGTGATGGSIPMPSMEIPEISDVKINWGKIWQTIETGLPNIFTNIGQMVDGFFTSIGQRFYNNASGWTTPLSNTFGDFFVSLGYTAKLSIGGIGDVFGGLVKTVRGLFEGDLPTIATGMFQTLGGIFKMGIGSLGTTINALVMPFRLAFNTATMIAEKFFNWLSKQTGIKGLKWDNLMVGLGNTLDTIKSKIGTFKNTISDYIGKIKTGVNWDKLRSGLDSNITKIKNSLKKIGTKVGNVVVSAFKTVFNKMITQVQNRLNTPINAINKLIDTINKLLPKGKRLSKLKTISLPRLAKGGIVNLPSSGIPVGNAIAGERGAEGVIPLTDSQQMALLGEAIGKYITINANITNSMNGRVISRELQKIQNDNNFAYNK